MHQCMKQQGRSRIEDTDRGGTSPSEAAPQLVQGTPIYHKISMICPSMFHESSFTTVGTLHYFSLTY